MFKMLNNNCDIEKFNNCYSYRAGFKAGNTWICFNSFKVLLTVWVPGKS